MLIAYSRGLLRVGRIAEGEDVAKPKQYVEIDTSVTIGQAAEIFRKSMSNGLLGAIKGSTRFDTPESTPFDSLDKDQPKFSVLAEVPTSRTSSSVIHLYAWDRGDRRQLRVVTLGGFMSLGVHTKHKLNQYVDALRRADPGARVHGDLSD